MSSDDRETSALLLKQVSQLRDLTAQVQELQSSLKMSRMMAADWQKKCKQLEAENAALKGEVS